MSMLIIPLRNLPPLSSPLSSLRLSSPFLSIASPLPTPFFHYLQDDVDVDAVPIVPGDLDESDHVASWPLSVPESRTMSLLSSVDVEPDVKPSWKASGERELPPVLATTSPLQLATSDTFDWPSLPEETTPTNAGWPTLANEKSQILPQSKQRQLRIRSPELGPADQPFDWSIVKNEMRRTRIIRWKRKKLLIHASLPRGRIYHIRAKYANARPRIGGRFISGKLLPDGPDQPGESQVR